MKNILLATALILMAASAIVAVAASHQSVHEKYLHEGENDYKKETSTNNN